MAVDEPSYPAFRPRAPWFGPDLQTVRNLVRGPVGAPVGSESQVLLPLADGTGDCLAGVLVTPEAAGRSAGDRPLVVLIHGLSGSSESTYMLTSARHWGARGHPVLRLNLRGAGESRAHCRLQYHAGRTEDLRDALQALDPASLRAGLILVGYSLGGNMLLKFLAEYGESFPIRAAASVSAPIDLSAASRRFLDPRNRVYHRRLLATMKLESAGGKAEITDHEREIVENAQSIYEFDELLVAPRNGYRDAEHYYAENNARRFLGGIGVPTLVIHARDDPWIPAESYTTHPFKENPSLHLLLARGGGHVGFHARDDRLPWHDRCITLFAAAVSARP
jgi:predicted alpha/beta-fold hydrolase